jgi:nucleotide-binding universal stress UspA family protein
VDSICARARDVGADLIVMTSHGRSGFSRAWLGSVADGVVRHAQSPVLMLRAAKSWPRRKKGTPLFARVLVPLDGSKFSLEVLTTASDLARCGNGSLILLRVLPPVPTVISEVPRRADGALIAEVDEMATRALVAEAQTELAPIVRSLADGGLDKVETHVVVDQRVGRAILEFAKNHRADAIAMSTHGRGATRLFVGSVADKVLRGSSVPILLRRPAGVVPERDWLTSETIDEQLPAIAGAS